MAETQIPTFGPVEPSSVVDVPTSPSVMMSSTETYQVSSPATSTADINIIKDEHVTDLAQDVFESMDAVLLGVSVVAVVVVILLLMIVVLRYMAHQKGTYYTNEEAFALKSDPDVQEVQEVQDIQEDSEEEES